MRTCVQLLTVMDSEVLQRALPVLVTRFVAGFTETVNQPNLRALAASSANRGLVVTVRACVRVWAAVRARVPVRVCACLRA